MSEEVGAVCPENEGEGVLRVRCHRVSSGWKNLSGAVKGCEGLVPLWGLRLIASQLRSRATL